MKSRLNQTCNDCHFFVKNYSLTEIPVSQAERTAFVKRQLLWTNSMDYSLKCYHDIWDAEFEDISASSILSKDRYASCYYFRFSESMDLKTAVQLQRENRKPSDKSKRKHAIQIDQDKVEFSINLKTFRKILERDFQLEEIRTLCFDMRIQFENLGHSNALESRVRELIHYCQRHGRLLELLITSAKVRPLNSWDELWD